MSPWAGQDEVAAGHLQWLVNATSKLIGGFKHFLFSPIIGMMIQSD